MENAPIEIWMAEDNDADVFLMREALDGQALVYHLEIFRDGEEAVRLMETAGTDKATACPDLLIIDLHLPKVDGREVLRRFRANASCLNTPVLVLSSLIPPEERAFIDGFARISVEEKPLNLDDYIAIGRRIKSILLLSASAN